MARYTGPVCRLCRRERMKLYLKGAKCDTMKCPIERRPYPPGEQGRARQRQGSEYLVQLREKQKARRIYGLMEKQFRNLYPRPTASRASPARTCSGCSSCASTTSRSAPAGARAAAQARQFVRHGHVSVNGRRVTIPSYQVRKGDVVELRRQGPRHDRDPPQPRHARPPDPPVARDRRRPPPGHGRDLPLREHIDVPVREQLIVELYSK